VHDPVLPSGQGNGGRAPPISIGTGRSALEHSREMVSSTRVAASGAEADSPTAVSTAGASPAARQIEHGRPRRCLGGPNG
jgi:hypothetical protein